MGVYGTCEYCGFELQLVEVPASNPVVVGGLYIGDRDDTELLPCCLNLECMPAFEPEEDIIPF